MRILLFKQVCCEVNVINRMANDYYETLEITRNATDADIKKA